MWSSEGPPCCPHSCCCSAAPRGHLLRSNQSLTIIFVGVSFHFLIMIIIMESCKAPTLRLKALNKHTHIMYIEVEIEKKREGWGQA